MAITGIFKTLANIVLPFYGIYYLLPFSAILFCPRVDLRLRVSNSSFFAANRARPISAFPDCLQNCPEYRIGSDLSFTLFQIPIVWWAFRDGMSFEAWRRYLVFSVISALVPNLLLVLLIVRTISRPLQKITLAAVQVTEGNYGTEIELRKSNDEIGLLANSFNEMSRKMLTDIEQLQKLNEQLIRTEKLAAMGTLAAGVAHEVNNPLASISSLIQMMQSSPGLDEKTSDNLRLISTQIQRISQVTRDMMDFARIRPAAKSAVNINEIIETSLRLASFDKAFQKLRLKKHLNEDLPKVYADGDQMEQVF